jgi:hypothetical protein
MRGWLHGFVGRISLSADLSTELCSHFYHSKSGSTELLRGFHDARMAARFRWEVFTKAWLSQQNCAAIFTAVKVVPQNR